MTSKKPPPPVEIWGFYGVMQVHAKAKKSWPVAIEHLCKLAKVTPAEAAMFLNSDFGEHFATDILTLVQDEGYSLSAATEKVILGLLDFKLTKATAAQLGLPFDQPYLKSVITFLHNIGETTEKGVPSEQ